MVLRAFYFLSVQPHCAKPLVSKHLSRDAVALFTGSRTNQSVESERSTTGACWSRILHGHLIRTN